MTTGYINAGGRGTRLNSIFEPHPEYGIAKALLEIGAPPIKLIDHHLAKLSHATLRNIVVGAGDQCSVADYHPESISMPSQMGTGGDLIQAVRDYPKLFGKQVLVSNVDTILDIDIDAFIGSHKGLASIALTKQRDVPNQDAFLVRDGQVIYNHETDNVMPRYVAERYAHQMGSSTGSVIVNAAFLQDFDWTPEHGQLSLYRDVVGLAMRRGGLSAYDNGLNYFKDVGTAQTWFTPTEELQPYISYGGDYGMARTAA